MTDTLAYALDRRSRESKFWHEYAETLLRTTAFSSSGTGARRR